MAAPRAASHRRGVAQEMSRNEASTTCAVCKKSIAVGEGHIRLGDSRIHVKCYEQKVLLKKR